MRIDPTTIEKLTPCECEAPGYCPLHAYVKSKLQWYKCATARAYYDASPGIPPVLSNVETTETTVSALPYVDEGCKHRGSALRQEKCSGCGAGRRVKVFSCEIHGECCVDKTTSGIKSCRGCDDRATLSPEEAMRALEE